MSEKRINQIEPYITSKDYKAVNDYLKSGAWLTEHKETENLEFKIKNYIDRKYSIAVPNGTLAIYLSLLSIGIKKGDKVAVPNLTMIATINAVLWAQATPVLIDTDEHMCMSYEKLINEKNLKCVIFVPLNGRTGNGELIEKWCKRNNVKLIEDSAHALGSGYSLKKKCGKLGDISVFSFTPHKIITMGQGGMLLMDNIKFYRIALKLKTFNRVKDKSDFHAGFGLNFKITDLQASIGNSQFESLNSRIKSKKSMLLDYKKLLPKNIEILDFKNFEIPWFIDLKFKSNSAKERAKKRLNKLNIETRYMYPPLSKQSYLKNYKHSDLKNSEYISDKILWMPSSISLKKSEIKLIASILDE